jgi:hypothetical protein
MNVADDEKIEKDRKKFEYADDGVCCPKRGFCSSGRTTYLFFSSDLVMMKLHAADRIDRGSGHVFISLRAFTND